MQPETQPQPQTTPQPQPEVPLQAQPPVQPPVEPPTQPPAKSSHKKRWFIIGGSVAVLALIIAALVIIVPGLSVSKEDYTNAAKDAQSVSGKYEEFSKTAQEYASLANTQADKETLATINTAMTTQYDELKVAKKALDESPALRDFETMQAYNAYSDKANKFITLADGYVKSIPFYVTMMDTCKDTGNGGANVFDQLTDFANRLQIQTKEDALKYREAKFASCLEAATKLNESGTNTFAQVGKVYVDMINSNGDAYELQFDEAKTLGDAKANENYKAALKKSEADSKEAITTISEKQKEEGEAAEFSKELESLIAVLKKKSA